MGALGSIIAKLASGAATTTRVAGRGAAAAGRGVARTAGATGRLGMSAVGGLLGGLAGGLGSSAGRGGSAVTSPSTSPSGMIRAGSGDSSGTSGGGVIPNLKPGGAVSVSDTMATGKLLVIAIKHLASIDNTLKNQVDIERFKIGQDHREKREKDFERKPKEKSKIMQFAGEVADNKWMQRIASGLGTMLLLGLYPIVNGVGETLASLGGLVDSMSEKVSTWGQGLSDVGKSISEWTSRQTRRITEPVSRAWGSLSEGAKAAAGSAVTAAGHAFNTARHAISSVAMPGTRLAQLLMSRESTKALAVLGSKAGLLTVLRSIPGLSVLLGMGFAGIRLAQGDYSGAAIELASGVAAMFPGIGTAGALGLQAGLAVTDYNRATNTMRGNRRANSPAGQMTGRGSGGYDRKSQNFVDPKQVYDYLIAKGMPKNHVLGILANMKAESSFNSGAIGDNGTSGGLLQWHDKRFVAMKAFVGANWSSNWKRQLDFIFKEEETKKYLARNFQNAIQASRDFTINWEIPENKFNEATIRLGNLRDFENIDQAVRPNRINPTPRNTADRIQQRQLERTQSQSTRSSQSMWMPPSMPQRNGPSQTQPRTPPLSHVPTVHNQDPSSAYLEYFGNIA